MSVVKIEFNKDWSERGSSRFGTAVNDLVSAIAFAHNDGVERAVQSDEPHANCKWINDAKAMRILRQVATDTRSEVYITIDTGQCKAGNIHTSPHFGESPLEAALAFKKSLDSKPAAIDPVAVYQRLVDRGRMFLDNFFYLSDFCFESGLTRDKAAESLVCDHFEIVSSKHGLYRRK